MFYGPSYGASKKLQRLQEELLVRLEKASDLFEQEERFQLSEAINVLCHQQKPSFLEGFLHTLSRDYAQTLTCFSRLLEGLGEGETLFEKLHVMFQHYVTSSGKRRNFLKYYTSYDMLAPQNGVFDSPKVPPHMQEGVKGGMCVILTLLRGVLPEQPQGFPDFSKIQRTASGAVPLQEIPKVMAGLSRSWFDKIYQSLGGGVPRHSSSNIEYQVFFSLLNGLSLPETLPQINGLLRTLGVSCYLAEIKAIASSDTEDLDAWLDHLLRSQQPTILSGGSAQDVEGHALYVHQNGDQYEVWDPNGTWIRTSDLTQAKCCVKICLAFSPGDIFLYFAIPFGLGQWNEKRKVTCKIDSKTPQKLWTQPRFISKAETYKVFPPLGALPELLCNPLVYWAGKACWANMWLGPSSGICCSDREKQFVKDTLPELCRQHHTEKQLAKTVHARALKQVIALVEDLKTSQKLRSASKDFCTTWSERNFKSPQPEERLRNIGDQNFVRLTPRKQLQRLRTYLKTAA